MISQRNMIALKMKQNQNVDFEPAQVVQDFMNYAKVNWIWSWNQSQEPEMDYILSSANGKEQRHYLNSSIALKARIPGRMEKTLNTSLPFFRLSLALLLFQVPARAQENVQEHVNSAHIKYKPTQNL